VCLKDAWLPVSEALRSYGIRFVWKNESGLLKICFSTALDDIMQDPIGIDVI